ncbi:MAG: tRNA (adenosine(37)-N6)-threonylcarbamoyltransferase complex dimerization subunit type 1 TsaB [Thiobacillaceae bacterium]|nr:tRNA (adenosine(37)-N6)-threonylcarbamoyltransferase complex dimerization subunit type 1 TsaB [Thiobacillaceae bacterium]
MKLLAFDTATEWCTAALWLDGEVHAVEVEAGQAHSRLLLPMLRELLATAGLTLGALDGIAFGRGPGSFTGLRIACSVAQGLGLGAELPVLGVTSLEAMAEETGAARVLAALDARMGELYGALLERAGEDWRWLEGPALYRPEAAPLPSDTGWVGCGSAFHAYAEAMTPRYAGRLMAVMPQVIPHARAIARLAAARFARGEGVPAEAAEPYYVRDKVALKTCER